MCLRVFVCVIFESECLLWTKCGVFLAANAVVELETERGQWKLTHCRIVCFSIGWQLH